MLLAVASFAQNAPITFEAGEPGADWTWTVFENETNPPLEIIANPDASGINTSATVAKFTALQAGAPFAGCESQHGADLGPFVIDANTSTIKIMVWKSVISNVGIKFAAPTGWAEPEILVPNTLVNQWEEITFDFSARNNPPASEGALDQIIIFPDFDARSQDNIVYFDNITFSEGGGTGNPDEPMTAAPTPTRNAANVISLFSDAYDDVPVDTWRTEWSAGTLTDLEIQGNPTKRYTALDFVGIETVANQIDATNMTHIHLDVWSPNFTFFRVRLVDFGPDGGFDGGDDTVGDEDYTTPAQGQWLSLDIPLANFEGLNNRVNMAQIILAAEPLGGATIFVDNVYFYNETTNTRSPFADQASIQLFPNPTKVGEQIRLDDVAAQIEVFDASGRLLKTAFNTAIVPTQGIVTQGVYHVKIRLANGKLVTKKVVLQ